MFLLFLFKVLVGENNKVGGSHEEVERLFLFSSECEIYEFFSVVSP